MHMHHSNPFWLIQEQFLICSGMKKFLRRCRVKMIEDTVDPHSFIMSGETSFLLLIELAGMHHLLVFKGFHWCEIGAMESENTLPQSSWETSAPFYNFREFFLITTFLQKVEASGQFTQHATIKHGNSARSYMAPIPPAHHHTREASRMLERYTGKISSAEQTIIYRLATQ